MGDHETISELASLQVTASMDHWDELNDFVEYQANKYLGSGKQSYNLRLACEELFSNIIRHSAGPSPSRSVMLTVSCCLAVRENRYSLMMQTEDNGSFFDPHFEAERQIGRDLPAAERPIGGLGLFLVQQSVDRVYYEWIHNKNRYRLFVDLHSPPARVSDDE